MDNQVHFLSDFTLWFWIHLRFACNGPSPVVLTIFPYSFRRMARGWTPSVVPRPWRKKKYRLFHRTPGFWVSPNGGSPYGILVAPIKFAKKRKDQSRPFVWGYQNSVWRSSVWGHSESARKLIPSHLAFNGTRIKLYLHKKKKLMFILISDWQANGVKKSYKKWWYTNGLNVADKVLAWFKLEIWLQINTIFLLT